MAQKSATLVKMEEDDALNASDCELEIKYKQQSEDDPLTIDEENMEAGDTLSSNEDDYKVEFIVESDEKCDLSDIEHGKESGEENEEEQEEENEEIEYLEEDLLDEEIDVSHDNGPVKKSRRVSREGLFSNANHMKLCNELKSILTHTNATPFKSKVGRVHCAYCKQRFPASGHQLRAHCRLAHSAAARHLAVRRIMHPKWLNEMMRLDIESLRCTACDKVIPAWSDMLKHLDRHDARLQLHSKFVPYLLGEELKCALCARHFPSFAALDHHMNAHYTNYVCGKCGDTYLTMQRLNTHKKIHDRGKFPCELCPKVFVQDKYRKKHVSVVHEKIPMHKCEECNEKFYKPTELKTHVDTKHAHKSRIYKCQQCDKVFQLQSYLLKHTRLRHTVRNKNIVCELCDKTFYFMYQLNNHMKWHKNDDALICTYCSTKMCNKSYLQKHIQTRHKLEAIETSTY